MKRLLVVTVVLGLMVSGCSKGPSVKLDKKEYKPGEAITVTYKAKDGWGSNAWIGIIPSNVVHGSEAENDKFDLTYKYLNKSASGTMSFNAPMKPGQYDIRMNNNDSDGKEVASKTFTVIGQTNGAERAKFKVGEAVMIEWKGKWWPGKVKEVRKDCWFITYDGYKSSWDECVGPNRIKKK